MDVTYLVLSECLGAGRVASAAKAFMALVRSLVTSKTSCSQEALATTLDVALVISLICMCALDMLLQMLLFEISLVTIVVRTSEWALVVVRSHMRGQSGRSIESFGASWNSTLDCLELGWELCPCWCC